MPRLRQVFRNGADTPLILVLELSTARFRLGPDEELTLFYDADARGNGPHTPLRIEYTLDGPKPEIVIYTQEHRMFRSDGSEADTDYAQRPAVLP